MSKKMFSTPCLLLVILVRLPYFYTVYFDMFQVRILNHITWKTVCTLSHPTTVEGNNLVSTIFSLSIFSWFGLSKFFMLTISLHASVFSYNENEK